METLNDLYEVFSGKEFAIPLWEVAVFVIFVSFCLLLGRHKLGLLATYGFVFYWGFISNMISFVDIFSKTSWGMPLYVFSGFLMFLIAIAGFWLESRD